VPNTIDKKTTEYLKLSTENFNIEKSLS